MRSSLGFLMDGCTACCLNTLGACLAWTGTDWSWCTLGSGTTGVGVARCGTVVEVLDKEVSAPGAVGVSWVFVVGVAATCVVLIGRGD